MRACRQLWAYRAVGSAGNIITASLVGGVGVFMLWQGAPGALPWVFVGGAAVGLGLNETRNILWRRAYRRMTKYPGPISAHFDAYGVGVESAEGDARHPWTYFRHYVLTQDYLFLLRDTRSFSILPRAAFGEAAQFNTVEELVKTNLPPLRRRWI